MCPACLANTVGLLVGALSSAGVATAYLFKKNPKEKTRTVVFRNEWLTARRQRLQKEKALVRRRDALAAERRELPAVKIEKDYA